MEQKLNIWHLVALATILAIELPCQVNAGKPPQPPHFVKKIQQQIDLQYGPINRFVLECIANAEPAPEYTWFKNNQPLATNSAGINLISDEDHSQLDFISPSPEHEGFYHCEAVNPLGKAKSTVVHVTNKPIKPPKGTVPPVFVKAPETELPSVGNTAKFQCIAEGKPEPSIVWTKNGEVLTGETGNQLILHNIGPADVANYACNASNVAGYEYKDVYLNILTVAADITDGPRDQIVSKGSNVTMNCEAEGFPKPNISWFLNDSQISTSDKYLINPETDALLVLSAEMGDQGTYKCVATNQGEDSKQGTLIVKSKTEIINGPSDLTVRVFSSIVMNCTVVSDLSEQLTVIWKKNNVDLNVAVYSADERSAQDENYSHAIENISLDDEGTYTCVAYTESTASNPATDSGLLSVSGIPPVLEDMAPLEPRLEGATINLPCRILEGYETPKISWFKNGLPIEEDEGIEINSDHLHIAKAKPMHSGEYNCKAVNSWGSTNVGTEIFIRKQTKILSEPMYLEFADGNSAMIDCNVEVDENLRDSLVVDWYRNNHILQVSPPSSTEIESRFYDDYEEDPKYIKHSNNTLEIRDMKENDVGFYECRASTLLEKVLKSESSQIYIPSDFPWIIIVLILIATICMIILFCCIWRIRKRNKGKGYYGVKDIEKTGGKHNKSDIYYTTEDGDSIMNEQDNMPLNNSTPTRTPIFTPKTIRHLANMDKSAGSVGSLLEDDEFLKRGMDEDGSFRERYAD